MEGYDPKIVVLNQFCIRVHKCVAVGQKSSKGTYFYLEC